MAARRVIIAAPAGTDIVNMAKFSGCARRHGRPGRVPAISTFDPVCVVGLTAYAGSLPFGCTGTQEMAYAAGRTLGQPVATSSLVQGLVLNACHQ